MSIPKASILTAVYNRKKYLVACIEGVIASTFTDWELIIVVDQSKDNSIDRELKNHFFSSQFIMMC